MIAVATSLSVVTGDGRHMEAIVSTTVPVIRPVSVFLACCWLIISLR